MRTLEQILKSYGDYHQNNLNKLTHIVGVPLIVLSVMIAANWLYVLWPLIAVTCFYYLYLSRKFGLIVLAIFIMLGLLTRALAPHPDIKGWSIFLSLFIGGWIIQFIGHGFEGKKPAFLDNITQILSAPLFVTDEILSFFKTSSAKKRS